MDRRTDRNHTIKGGDIMKCPCDDNEMVECYRTDEEYMGDLFRMRKDVSYLYCPVCDCVMIWGKPYKGDTE